MTLLSLYLEKDRKLLVYLQKTDLKLGDPPKKNTGPSDFSLAVTMYFYY